MAFVPAPNTIQCDILFMLYGQRVENVVHVEVPGGVDAPTIQDTANEVGNWVEDSYLPYLSEQIVFLGVEAKNLSIEAGGVAIYNAAANTHGGVNGPAVPGGTAFCVSLRTAASGRSYRGRKFVPGVPESSRVGNQVTSDYAALMLAAFNDLIAVLTAVDKILVIVSRIADGVSRVTAVTTPVTSPAAVDLNLDSQRRRLTGRGA